ncbi:MAG: putative multidrug ABC transporter ATP-binding protein YbhF [Anaerolineales bacterium]|nr:putative multidrug ABC transporter ATP-binding protein YbhF [Anaerolineales bacterium]
MESSDNRVIVTDSLTKSFDDTVAVDELNLAVERGEIFGLVGPDGAGKTTTIRILAAIMWPSRGQATVLGYDTVTEAEAIKTDIGYMAQRFNLYRDLTVWENLNFFADVFEVTGDERRERISRLLEFARLTRFKDRRAHHLSGGMQKKLALACTLVHEPQLLLLDEPTTGVDPVSRREFWEILTDLHLQGITIFVSTPYMDEAERCSRVGLLHHGRLIICDAPERVRQGLEGELLGVRASNLKRAREIASQLEGVLEVQTYGDRLHVFVDDASRREPEIVDHLTGAGIAVHGIRQMRPRMEEAFISLIRREQVSSDQ